MGNMLGDIKAFLKNFSIRRLKMGQIIEFLDLLEMEESKNAFGALLKSVYVSTGSKGTTVNVLKF